MGQAGSIEQKAAVQDVLRLRANDANANTIRHALQTFSLAFPPDEAWVHDETNVVSVKDRKLVEMIHALLQDQTEANVDERDESLIDQLLRVFRRVIQWRELHRLCAKLSMKPFLLCLEMTPEITLSSLETLLAILSPCADASDRAEMSNRRRFAEDSGFLSLHDLLVKFCSDMENDPDAENVLRLVLDLYNLPLRARRTYTDHQTLRTAHASLHTARVPLLDLCHHTNSLLQQAAINLVRELFHQGSLEQIHELQESAREYGALLHSLLAAISTAHSLHATSDSTQTPLKDKHIELIEMFCARNQKSRRVMNRIVPVDHFLSVVPSQVVAKRPTRSASSLTSKSLPFDLENYVSSSSANLRTRFSSRHISTSVFDTLASDARAQGECWRSLVQQLSRDHKRPELMWNEPVRQELREALVEEAEDLEVRNRDARSNGEGFAVWHHDLFSVTYTSIDKQLVVAGYFVDLLIPALSDYSSPSFEVTEPVILAWHLSDRLVTEDDLDRQLSCVRCLRLVMTRYAMRFHGQLPTTHLLRLIHTRDENPSPVFLRECFLLLTAMVETMRPSAAEREEATFKSMAKGTMDVLTDTSFLSCVSASARTLLDSEDTSEEDDDWVEFVRDKPPSATSEAGGLVRAGVHLLLSVVRRAKHTLLVLRPKRIALCRLLGLEALDHTSVQGILSILKQLQALDQAQGCQVLSASRRVTQKGVVDTKWTHLALVYVLYASCDPKGKGMTTSSAEFLQQLFCDKSRQEGCSMEVERLLIEAVGCSAYGMRLLLEAVSPADFAKVFNADETRAGDVRWGKRQRCLVYMYLDSSYVAKEWNRMLHDVEVPPEGDGDVLLDGLFLCSYVHGNGHFLTSWTQDAYANLLATLFQKLNEWGTTTSVSEDADVRIIRSNEDKMELWQAQSLVLRALSKLVKNHCQSVSIHDTWYESALAPLRRSLLGEADQVRGADALQFFSTVLSTSATNVNIPSCLSFLDTTGLLLLSEALEKMQTTPYQQLLLASKASARKLLFRLADLLVLIASNPIGVSALARNRRIILALLSLSSMHQITTESTDAATVALHSLAYLCHYPELRALVIEAGGILQLVQTAAFCPAEQIVGNTSVEKNVASTPSPYFSSVRSAALVLRACFIDVEDLESSSTYLVLAQLLTPCFVKVLLQSPDSFVLQLQSQVDIDSITLIWTASMRDTLQKTLANELSKVEKHKNAGTWPRWHPDHFVAADSFHYLYPELHDKLFIDNVYVRNLLAADNPLLDDINLSSFTEALLVAIQSHENVVQILAQRQTSDPSKQETLQTLRQAYNLVIEKYPQHNLRVEPSLSPLSSDSHHPFDDERIDEWQDSIAPRMHRMSSSDIDDLTV